MAKERFSKLQKWIITECFKTTVLLDRSNLKMLKGTACYNEFRPEYYKECSKTIVKKRNTNNDIFYYCNKHNRTCEYFKFYRDDILLSYFELEPDRWKYPFSRQQHFKGSPNNNKAYVSVGRTIKNLEEQGYIIGFRWEGMEIILTDKGKEKALQLLNLDRSVIKEPPLLNAEEQEKKKQHQDKLIESLTRQLKA